MAYWTFLDQSDLQIIIIWSANIKTFDTCKYVRVGDVIRRSSFVTVNDTVHQELQRLGLRGRLLRHWKWWSWKEYYRTWKKLEMLDTRRYSHGSAQPEYFRLHEGKHSSKSLFAVSSRSIHPDARSRSRRQQATRVEQSRDSSRWVPVLQTEGALTIGSLRCSPIWSHDRYICRYVVLSFDTNSCITITRWLFRVVELLNQPQIEESLQSLHGVGALWAIGLFR